MMAVLEHLVGALNIFTKAIAPNSRVQICKLGENIMTGLLYLWDNCPSDALKVQAEAPEVLIELVLPGQFVVCLSLL